MMTKISLHHTLKKRKKRTGMVNSEQGLDISGRNLCVSIFGLTNHCGNSKMVTFLGYWVEVYGNSCYFLFNFSLNPKRLSNKKKVCHQNNLTFLSLFKKQLLATLDLEPRDLHTLGGGSLFETHLQVDFPGSWFSDIIVTGTTVRIFRKRGFQGPVRGGWFCWWGRLRKLYSWGVRKILTFCGLWEPWPAESPAQITHCPGVLGNTSSPSFLTTREEAHLCLAPGAQICFRCVANPSVLLTFHLFVLRKHKLRCKDA
jgi:hypothetical protein